MKKSIFSIAILAASFCMMASCGNKSGNNAAGADSTEVAPEVAVQNLPEVKTSFEQKTFTVSVPEGWDTTPNRDAETSDIMVFKGDMEKIMSIPCVIINVDVLEDSKTFEEGVQAVQDESGAKPIDDITIDGKTYKGFELKEGEVTGTIMAREENGVTLKLPSGEVRRFLPNCRAVVGMVGNGEHEAIVLGKAGRKRWLGIRPTVRGVAMNPVDHPMGGGEGRTSGGGPAESPWGKLAKGGKTRKPGKASNRMIVKRRK